MEKERRNGCFSEEEVDLLKLQFTDLFGQLKMVEMTGGQAEKAIKEGYAINRYALGGLRCEGAAPDSETLKDRAGNMELYLKPDMTTYQILPWDSGQENVAGVICDVMDPDGNPSWADTRGLLKETVSRLEKLGLQIYFDFQCEFYLFHSDDEGRPTTITHEVAGYYDAGPIDLAESVRRDIMLSLAEAGMEAESSHHGLTPGQHGFLIPARCGTEAADYLQTFKTAVKRIAKRHGLHATFLPKPDRDSDGSGLHVGITLRDKEGRTAREAAGYFRAGILKHHISVWQREREAFSSRSSRQRHGKTEPTRWSDFQRIRKATAALRRSIRIRLPIPISHWLLLRRRESTESYKSFRRRLAMERRNFRRLWESS